MGDSGKWEVVAAAQSNTAIYPIHCLLPQFTQYLKDTLLVIVVVLVVVVGSGSSKED